MRTRGIGEDPFIRAHMVEQLKGERRIPSWVADELRSSAHNNILRSSEYQRWANSAQVTRWQGSRAHEQELQRYR